MPPQTTYLPSAKRARVMTMNIGAITLKHRDALVEHEHRLTEHDSEIGHLLALRARGFFGRLSWLLRGK